MNGGGTPNLDPDSPGSYASSTGVFGGLGGGGGPGFDSDPACARCCAGLMLVPTSLPASANGGGAANLVGGGLGGEGSRGGVGSLAGSFIIDLRAGGGAGGAALPRPAGAGKLPGLSDRVRDGPVGGGGGGGALFL